MGPIAVHHAPCKHRLVGVGGFTLMELLVVITVIALLASLLLPAVRLARSSADAAKCGSNLRQFSVANEAYALDWDGSGCPTGAYGSPFFSLASPYLDGTGKSGLGTVGNALWKGCPDWKNSRYFNDPNKNSFWKGFCRNPFLFYVRRNGITRESYRHDSVGGTQETGTSKGLNDGIGVIGEPISWAQVPYRSERIWLGDGYDFVYNLLANHQDGSRHRKKPSYLFVDGHVARLSTADAANGFSMAK